MPRARHSSASLNFSAFPPPDFRFMISTGWVAGGTGTPGVGAEISEARSRASEYRPSATAATAKPRLATNAQTSCAARSTTMHATTATTATAALTSRAVLRRVSVFHAAATATASNAAAASMVNGSLSSNSTSASPAPMIVTYDATAAIRRDGFGGGSDSTVMLSRTVVPRTWNRPGEIGQPVLHCRSARIPRRARAWTTLKQRPGPTSLAPSRRVCDTSTARWCPT